MAKVKKIGVNTDGDVEVLLTRDDDFVWIDVDRYLAVRIRRGLGGNYKIDAYRAGSETADPLLTALVNVNVKGRSKA